MGKQYLNGVLYGTGEIIKFSPEIYSLEEREVGVWTDGKPLYEKTVHINSLPSTAYVLTSYPHGISNIDTICTHNAFAKWSSGEVANLDHIGLVANDSTNVFRASLELTIDNTNIYIRCGADRSGLSADVIIQYTKTTDTPGSGHYTTKGGEAVHYDGTEQIIGTWFGKTLYQKTLTVASNASIGSSSWTPVSWNNAPTNVEKLLGCDIHLYGTEYVVPNPYVNLRFRYVNNAICCASELSATLYAGSIITFRYTKTT